MTTPPTVPAAGSIPAIDSSSTGFPASIAIAQLKPSRTNPRKRSDPAFIAELAQSIRKHGVLTAIMVRPYPKSPADAFEIVAGEQRYRAAREAGLTHMPALVREMTDDEVLEVQLLENLQRRDLTAMEEADGYNHLAKKGYKVERIAERVGRSLAYVYDRMRLLSLSEACRELLLTNRITLGHAIELAKLRTEDQARVISEHNGGLWDRQYGISFSPADIDGLTGAGEGTERAPSTDENFKTRTVAEMKAWIDSHVRFEAEPTEQNMQLFPETVDQLQKATDSAEKVVHITLLHQVDPGAKAGGPKVLSAVSWRRADGKAGSRECSASVTGVIVVGPGRGQAFRVCLAKKTCTVHWGAEIRERKRREAELAESGETGASRQQLEAEKRAEAERQAKERMEALERAKPAILKAAAEAIRSTSDVKLRGWFMDMAFQRGVPDLAGYMKTPKSHQDLVMFFVMAQIKDSVDYPWADQAHLADELHGIVDVNRIVASTSAAEDTARAAKPKKPAKTAKAEA